MASPNGVSHTSRNARNRITQPVLPALPLPRRTRGADTCFKHPAQPAHRATPVNDLVESTLPATKTDDAGTKYSKDISASQSNGSKRPNDFEASDLSTRDAGTDSRAVETIQDASSLAGEISGVVKNQARQLITTTSLARTLDNHDIDTDSIHGKAQAQDQTQNQPGLPGNAARDVEDNTPGAGIGPVELTAGALLSEVSPTANKAIANGSSHVERSSTNHTTKHSMASSVEQTDNLGVKRYEFTQNSHVSSPPLRMDRQKQSTSSIRPQKMLTISEHFLHLANTKQWADWIIEINQPRASMPPFVSYAHGFVLLRSDRLRRVISVVPDPTRASNFVSFHPVRSIQPHAFEAALRFLYSDTVLSAEALLPQDTYMDRHARAHVVDYALSYWAAGLELAIEPVTARAFDLIASMIDWDIAELLIKEASELRSATTISRSSGMSHEISAMAESLLRLVYGLFIHRLDLSQFKLDHDAQAQVIPSRCTELELGRSTSNPALAGMVFGSMPTSSSQSPVPCSTASCVTSLDMTASAILLNLSFGDLYALSQQVISFSNQDGIRIMTDVVTEREKRRLQVLNGRSVSNKQRMSSSAAWDTLAYHEFMVDGELQCEHTGSHFPSRQ